MLAHDGPVLVNAIVTKDENCYPMVAPGQSNARMIGLPKLSPGVVKCSIVPVVARLTVGIINSVLNVGRNCSRKLLIN